MHSVGGWFQKRKMFTPYYLGKNDSQIEETKTTIRIGVQSFSSIKTSTFWPNWGLVALCYETVVERCLFFCIQNSGGQKKRQMRGKWLPTLPHLNLVSGCFDNISHAWWISISTSAGWMFTDKHNMRTNLVMGVHPPFDFMWHVTRQHRLYGKPTYFLGRRGQHLRCRSEPEWCWPFSKRRGHYW